MRGSTLFKAMKLTLNSEVLKTVYICWFAVICQSEPENPLIWELDQQSVFWKNCHKGSPELVDELI